jgi:type I restriction enzyme M protein
MMPFFALSLLESRLLRSLDELMVEEGITDFADVDPHELAAVIRDRGKGYNAYLVEQRKTLRSIAQNDKTFETDFHAYLAAFDADTRWLLGVEAGSGEKFLDIGGVIDRLKAKKILFAYAKQWSQIDLKPFNNSEITTLEEHIKRRWADISAETAGEQYTPDDVIDLIADIIAAKLPDSGGIVTFYDCTCGGGNLLFGVEDRIKEKTGRVTQTYGQDWNDALYALAAIESRFRHDSHIAHGNTLTDDKYPHITAQVVVANPPYGVSWKGYQKEILNDKTLRFKHLPSVADGQLLFTQHLIDKLDEQGLGVIVHNGSTLFSGDAGSGESNIRKWMLDSDMVEAVIQLPTDEFFNTGIHTYLWVLNKAKDAVRKDKVMLIDASQKFRPLRKNKGAKRREVDPASRQAIVDALTGLCRQRLCPRLRPGLLLFQQAGDSTDQRRQRRAQHRRTAHGEAEEHQAAPHTADGARPGIDRLHDHALRCGALCCAARLLRRRACPRHRRPGLQGASADRRDEAGALLV